MTEPARPARATGAAGASRPGTKTAPQVPAVSLLTEDDLYLFNEGTHSHLFEKLGAHPLIAEGIAGTYFAVWAPDAEAVSVVADFNGWDPRTNPLRPKGRSGIWEGFVPGAGKGALYKYHVVSRVKGHRADKTDPFAFYCETSPKTRCTFSSSRTSHSVTSGLSTPAASSRTFGSIRSP